MITIIGTHHEDFRRNGHSIADRIRLEHIDKIFTEGFSREGLEQLREFEAFRNDITGVHRGPEPESLESADAEVVYLDDGLSDQAVEQLLDAAHEVHEEEDIYPFDGLEEALIKSSDTRSDYITFFEKLRDMDFSEDDGYSDYAALSRTGYEALIQASAEELNRDTDAWEFVDVDNSGAFLAGLDEYDITFQDYVDVFGEDRGEAQDLRDQEWYDQITEQMDEDENVLIVAGIKHVLDYDNTVRNLLEQDYETSVTPFRRF